MERLLPVSWVTRTPPPYVPLESDLTFKLMLSKPAMIHAGSNPDPARPEGALPTSGTVGSPFVKGAPFAFMEYILHQGVDHYVFDDAPSARPMKWWNQKSNMPYNGHMYFVRSGLLDHVVPSESQPNPLAPSRAADSRHRRGRASRVKKSMRAGKAALPQDSAPAGEEHHPPSPSVDPAEEWNAEQGPDLVGHDNQAREELEARDEELQRAQARPAIADIIPLGDRAANRLTMYEQHARKASESDALDRPRALLKRQLRLRLRRRRGPAENKQTDESKTPGGNSASDPKGQECADKGENSTSETDGS
ncbi:unnamed protein product [Phytomonas sp. EM1]|nr:unnamed protein product [Phytomonas sp. EM1]|eukprot:CCW65486.1 unnamed protein product [Phytomonas sp. isolate EM1]